MSRRKLTLLIAAPLLLLAAVAIAVFANHAPRTDAFMGDSLTWWWRYPRVNYGVRGETTEQMLARFQSQIPGHGYRRVYILGGTNDVLLNVDPYTTINNLNVMAQLAQDDGAEPILAEIPPIYAQNGTLQPQVQQLNHLILTLAEIRHLKLVDYYDALNGHPEGYSDGIHMKRRNYLRMEWALWHPVTP